MARVTRGVRGRRRRKAVLQTAKGFYGRRKNTYRVAKETVLRAGAYAYVGRKLRKRDFRSLWIQRINAAARQMGLKYSTVIDMLNKANIDIDRKMLADLAYHDLAAFENIVQSAQQKIAA
jgi:large subunit ribosomal protein L20